MGVFIIAEAGVNHNGSLEIAKKLIDAAAEAGADAVKFQTFQAEKLVCSTAQKADYQKKSTDKDESQLAMLKRLELTEEMHKELIQHCVEKNILFLSTPFDIDSANMLNNLGMSIFKIPSGEITNLPYLRAISSLGKKIIMSTGMSSMQEVKEAVEVLQQNEASEVSILHCNTEYPTPMEDVNLRAMLTIKNELMLPVGYSDHTRGIEIPIAAVALGAQIIEKHFTLSREMEGPDHKASLEPNELREMVQAIRNVEKAMGDGIKSPSVSEMGNREVVRKSIVAKKLIRCGDILTEENITTKRPGTGISPLRWDEVIGKKAIRDFDKDELIQI